MAGLFTVMSFNHTFRKKQEGEKVGRGEKVKNGEEMKVRHSKFNIHNSTFVLVAVALLAGCAAPPPAQQPTQATARPAATAPATPMTFADLVSADAKLETVVTGSNLFEGPLWLPDGRWIVSEIAANTVWQFDASGNKTVFLQPSNNANGRALDAGGQIIQAEHGSQSLTQITPDGTRTVLAERFEGKTFNSPNDIAIQRDGTIWFSDPSFGLGNRASELGFTGVFKLDSKTGTVTLLTRALDMPNGIAFSLDEGTAYISASRRITAFPINPDGTLGQGRDFGAGNDGLKVDSFGNVWSTGDDSVTVYAPDGQVLGRIPTPEATTNLAFGGPDGRTVLITTFKGVYRIEARLRLAPAR
jgi:gluconolactonase